MERIRTPSPPPRARTPPAPQHGPKYDGYEPYAPRRSTRVAARNLHSEETQLSPSRLRTTRNITPTSSGRKSATHATQPTLSPPASPMSPAKHPKRPAYHVATAIDSDSDHAAPTPGRRFLSTMAPRGMLPTPAKTPRKRALQSEEALGPTARILFPTDRPVNVDDVVPTPRKSRKINFKSLDSLDAQSGKAEEQITIYTDSKDRIPTKDAEEDNPFVSSRVKKGKAKAKPSKSIKYDETTDKALEDARLDKGIVFKFRGKTVFRRFDDVPDISDEELRSPTDDPSFNTIRRSGVTPNKKLFKEEIARQRLRNGDDVEEDEEEAITDIELHLASPSRRTSKAAVAASAAREATPPPTKRVKRQFSFESWRRVKSSSQTSASSQESRKRTGSPLESGVGKRSRSERSELSTSSMSIEDF